MHTGSSETVSNTTDLKIYVAIKTSFSLSDTIFIHISWHIKLALGCVSIGKYFITISENHETKQTMKTESFRIVCEPWSY